MTQMHPNSWSCKQNWMVAQKIYCTDRQTRTISTNSTNIFHVRIFIQYSGHFWPCGGHGWLEANECLPSHVQDHCVTRICRTWTNNKNTWLPVTFWFAVQFCMTSNLIKWDLNVKSFVRVTVCRGRGRDRDRDRDSASTLRNLVVICMMTPCGCTHCTMLGREGSQRRRRGVKCIGQYLHQSGFGFEFCHLIQCIQARNQTQTELLICFQKWILISLEKLTELWLQLTYRGHNCTLFGFFFSWVLASRLLIPSLYLCLYLSHSDWMQRSPIQSCHSCCLLLISALHHLPCLPRLQCRSLPHWCGWIQHHCNGNTGCWTWT